MWSNVSNLIGGSEFLLVFHKEKLFLYILEVGKNKKRKAKQTNKQTTKKKRKQNKQLIANKQTKKQMPRLV